MYFLVLSYLILIEAVKKLAKTTRFYTFVVQINADLVEGFYVLNLCCFPLLFTFTGILFVMDGIFGIGM